MWWDIGWIAGLANYNFHSHYKSGKSNVEADALSRIDWKKCGETIQKDSIKAIVTAAITGDLANVESILCSVQTLESFLSIQSETVATSKAITTHSIKVIWNIQNKDHLSWRA